MQETFAYRLNKILQIRNMKPSELSEKSGVPKSAISQYLSGLYEAKQKNVDKLSKALNVNEAWLMGLDVPMERNSSKYNGINLEGLTDNQLAKINEYIKFIRSQKNDED